MRNATCGGVRGGALALPPERRHVRRHAASGCASCDAERTHRTRFTDAASAPGLGSPLPHAVGLGTPWVAGQVRAALVRADGTLTAAALPIVIGETVRSSSTLPTESTHSTQ